MSRCLTTFSRPRYIRTLWPGDVRTAGQTAWGFWRQSPARTWCPYGGVGGVPSAVGEIVGPYKHPSSLSLCPILPGRRAPFLVSDQLQACLSLEKAQLETLGTELWLAPGIIWLVRGFPTSLSAHGEFLDGIAPVANDL